MATELLTGDNNIALMSYKPKSVIRSVESKLLLTIPSRWRKQRRAVHEVMNIRDVSAYDSFQERAAVNLVAQLLYDVSGNWQRHCNKYHILLHCTPNRTLITRAEP